MLIYLQMIESEEDKSKFASLYQRYRTLMLTAASKILSEPADAEDAVHQAFLTLVDNLDKVRKIDSPETRGFLVIITEHKAIDILRSRKNVQNAGLMEEIMGIETPLPGDNGLADAMVRLPARYREVLLLRYDNGLKTRDIARLLDLKVDTAQKLIWRAKEALKKQLDADVGAGV